MKEQFHKTTFLILPTENNYTTMFARRSIFICVLLLIVMKSTNAQVNLQTGGATFSLPMFGWKDDKSRLSAPVALSYSSGNGLRVNDVASNVGQGWRLVAGGAITRMQAGEPDDQLAFAGDGTDQDIRKYPAGYLFASSPAYNGCPNSLVKYPIYGARNQVYAQKNIRKEDRQLDYFTFQFNGKAGMFILDPSNGGSCVALGDTKMKISYKNDFTMATNNANGIRTTITSFTIQDVDGLTYIFSLHGLTQVLEHGYCDKDLVQQHSQPNLSAGGVYHQKGFSNASYVNPWVIGNWYLKEIDDSLTSRKVVFNYTTNTVNSEAGADFSYNQWHDYTIVTHNTSIAQTLDIASIQYPDGHQVTFNYSANPRADLNGEFALSTVDITYQANAQTRYLAEYRLNTTYMMLKRYGTPVTPYQKSLARLCLRSVSKIGPDLKEDTPPYIFDYYMGSDVADDYVPPPFFWARDVWGYYNGDKSTNYTGTSISLQTSLLSLQNDDLKGLCFFKSGLSSPAVFLNSKPGYAQNGLLRQVIYPTGGTLTYQYAQNTGIFEGGTATNTVGGVHVSQTSSTDGGYSNGCSNPIVTQYNYVNSAGTAPSLWALETPVNYTTTGSSYAPERKNYVFKLKCLPFGCCSYSFMYPGILSEYETIDISRVQKFFEAIEPALGILSTVTTILDVMTIVTGTTGVLAWVAVILDIVSGLIKIYTTCFTDYSKSGTTNVYYNYDLNNVSPLPTQFKRVEVVEGTGGIGKTVHDFTSSDDYTLWVPAGGNPNFVARQRFAPWAYGLPKLITSYNAAGNIIKQTQYVYDTSNAKTLIGFCNKCLPNPSGLSTQTVSCRCGVLYTSSQRNTDWSSAAETYATSTIPQVMTVDFYGMYTGRVLLSATYDRTYKTGDATHYVEKMTAYSYNSWNNYDIYEISTKQSNGDIIYQDIRYSSDFSGAPISQLLRYNIISLPVATTTSISKATGGGMQYLGEKVTEFVQVANGDVKPSRILEQRFVKPVPISSMTYYTGPGSNTSNYKVPQIFSYDSYGNTIGITDEGSRTVTNVYGYNDKFVTATVVNATTSDYAAYTSFETSDLNDWARSGWTVNGVASYDNSRGITGNSSFILTASNSLSATLNTAKSYTSSFWATSSIVVNGATLTKSGPTYNGFTYYEYTVPQGTASISITGTATIDELRLYPQNARMLTITYDPILGKTAECDENNRITYYEYDNIGRLQFVRDEKKNIIKMNEYNNVSAAKQTGCPGTYSNHALSELFTKSNCSNGYQPGNVSYTVPAGRYTSTISQMDADVKAEMDLLTNGPGNANTYGSCSLIYYNTAQSEADSSEGCPLGYEGGWVTYTVPAGKYTSLVSQADADQKAQTEIAADAIAYANSSAHRSCVFSTNPDWESDNPAFRCQVDVNGNYTGHREAFLTDINPNSATYNTQSWKDIGIDETNCPHTPGSAPSLSGSSYSTVTRTGVITGQPGSQVTITVTLNSSSADANLSGNVGTSINLSGSGSTSVSNIVTIPATTGYISWSLTLSGTPGYISSNITVK